MINATESQDMVYITIGEYENCNLFYNLDKNKTSEE